MAALARRINVVSGRSAVLRRGARGRSDSGYTGRVGQRSYGPRYNGRAQRYRRYQQRSSGQILRQLRLQYRRSVRRRSGRYRGRARVNGDLLLVLMYAARSGVRVV